MLRRNIGRSERIQRVILGLVMLAAFFIVEGRFDWLYLIGVVPLVTGLLGTCPAYRLLGIDTCRTH